MSEYGQRMGQALLAVLQMQADSVKLLRDLDKRLQGYETLLGNVATLNLGSSINRNSFIAEALLRQYSKDGKWGDVLGVNICYFDSAKPSRLPEPIFVAAHLRYSNPNPDPQQKQLRPWDPWYAFLEWSANQTFRTALTLEPPFKTESLEAVTVAAIPLFEVTSLDVAAGLIELVKGA